MINNLKEKINLFKESPSGFLKKHFKKVLILLAIAIFGIYFFSKEKESIDIGHMENGNLEEIVSVSGIINPNQESSLSFEKSGKIQNINVKVGDKVSAGQILATINGGNDYAGVLNAEAGVRSAEANLADALNGASDLDISVKKQTLDAAIDTLSLANDSVDDNMRSVYSSITDILNFKLSNVFSYSYFYRLNYNSCDQGLQSKIEQDRKDLDDKIVNLKNSLDSFNIDSSSDEEANQKVNSIIDNYYKTSLNIYEFLNNTDKLLSLPCTISDPTVSSYKGSISGAKTAINANISTITSLRSQINTLRNNVSSAQTSLNLIQAGPSSEKIKVLRAALDSARANLISARSTNAKNFLSAPFNGVITQVNINAGEISVPGQASINLISEDNLELKIKLSEIDIVKVKAGNTARVYLDTYGDSVEFPGVVKQVYPAPIKEGNTSVYYAVIGFTGNDERIKSGMNASAKIVTISKEAVNYIDSKYIKIENGIAKVKVVKDIKKINTKKENDNISWKTIEIGIRDSNGKIEVLSGLSKDENLLPLE